MPQGLWRSLVSCPLNFSVLFHLFHFFFSEGSGSRAQKKWCLKWSSKWLLLLLQTSQPLAEAEGTCRSGVSSSPISMQCWGYYIYIYQCWSSQAGQTWDQCGSLLSCPSPYWFWEITRGLWRSGFLITILSFMSPCWKVLKMGGKKRKNKYKKRKFTKCNWIVLHLNKLKWDSCLSFYSEGKALQRENHCASSVLIPLFTFKLYNDTIPSIFQNISLTQLSFQQWKYAESS